MTTPTSPPRPWTRQDIPTPETMDEYLAMIRSARQLIPSGTKAPEAPVNMDHLTYRTANDIEAILLAADRVITNMESSWFVSGEIDAGGF